MRHSIAIALATLLLLLPVLAPAAETGHSEHKTFHQILTTRPAPRLDDLAERSAPDRLDDAATESFWDLLKLRDNPDPAPVPALARILDAHAGSNRIHRFAAAQALLTTGTDEALRALELDVLRPDYPVDLATMYAAGWEMPEPARSRLVGRYLLRNVGDGAVGVTAAPAWQDRDGRHVLAVTVTLTNRSERPLAVLLDAHRTAERLYFRSPAGTFATPASGIMRTCPPQPPRWVRLRPGASDRFEVTLELTRDPAVPVRLGTDRPAAVLSEGGGGSGFGLGGFGRYQVYAMVAQVPVSEAQLETLRVWAKDVGDPKELWIGRAVSEPS